MHLRCLSNRVMSEVQPTHRMAHPSTALQCLLQEESGSALQSVFCEALQLSASRAAWESSASGRRASVQRVLAAAAESASAPAWRQAVTGKGSV